MSGALEFMTYGLCAQVDPEEMFPDSRDLAGIKNAKRLCGLCEVRIECLEWAVEPTPRNRMPDGIVGGLTPDERRKLRHNRAKRRRLAAAAA